MAKEKLFVFVYFFSVKRKISCSRSQLPKQKLQDYMLWPSSIKISCGIKLCCLLNITIINDKDFQTTERSVLLLGPHDCQSDLFHSRRSRPSFKGHVLKDMGVT